MTQVLSFEAATRESAVVEDEAVLEHEQGVDDATVGQEPELADAGDGFPPIETGSVVGDPDDQVEA